MKSSWLRLPLLRDVCDGEEGLEGGQTGWGHRLGIGAKRIAKEGGGGRGRGSRIHVQKPSFIKQASETKFPKLNFGDRVLQNKFWKTSL